LRGAPVENEFAKVRNHGDTRLALSMQARCHPLRQHICLIWWNSLTHFPDSADLPLTFRVTL
jgi:hypothetical protein